MLSWLEKHNGFCWFITIVIAIIIFYISSLTFKSEPLGTNTFSILYHVLAFFSFALFLQISIVKGKNKKLTLLAIFIAVLYGISDELHQYFVPGRSSAISDVFLDTLGIIYSSMIYLISLVYRERNGKLI